MKSKTAARALKKVLALTAAVMLLLSMTSISFATDTQAVYDAQEGVFTIMYCYPLSIDSHEWYAASIGSGFLINEDTVITCYHVLHDTDFNAYLKEHDSNYKSKMEIRVYYTAGSYYKATEINNFANSAFDFTAVKLESTIGGARQLSLVDDIENNLKAPDRVYALGNPVEEIYFTNDIASTYTSNGVTTREGIMNKFDILNNINVISHTAALASGMSGGPLVNSDGQVVGINRSHILGTENYYSVPISQVINSLNITGIEYNSANVTTSTPVAEETTVAEEAEVTEATVDFSSLTVAISRAEGKQEDSYTAESFAALKTALESAKSVKDNSNATQTAVDEAAAALQTAIDNLAEKKGLDTKVIIMIAAGALVLIAVIIIIVVVSKKGKKNVDEPADFGSSGGWAPPANGFQSSPSKPVDNFVPVGGSSAETGVLNNGSNETTVLSSGSNETTVLAGKPYGKLVRKSNNEVVQISSASFVIGKDRSKVSYCIDNNATVSRSHARIVKSGDKASIVDLGSKNGTFVNGVKCSANVAVTLNSGDKITLSDEEFTFEAL